MGVALDECRQRALGLGLDFDALETREDLLPQDPQLQLRDAGTHAVMDAVTEREVPIGVGTLEIDRIGVVAEHGLVPVSREVPEQDLIVLLDQLAAELDILRRSASHVGEGGLPANDLRDEVGDQTRVGDELVVLLRPLVQRIDTARHGVAGGVVAADDQQDQVTEVLHR